jgi:uncharacterized protein (TIGR03435 family)
MRALLVVALAGAVVHGQAPPTSNPVFEVASVKPNKSADQRVMMVAEPNGRFTATNIKLPFLIRTAYQLQDNQIVGGPSWLNSDRFDIVAKAEDDQYPGDLLARMRSLLADRFKLTSHSETRELPVYALVLMRNYGTLGPRLRLTECPQPPRAPCANVSNGAGRLTLRAAPFSQIVQFLSPSVNRVVVDRTNLTGSFDLDLEWTPDQLPQAPPGSSAVSPVDPDRPSIFTAVREQLGLRLEASRASVDVLVIDRVERPTED